MLRYKSDNGYTGVMDWGNFMGFRHIDLSIYDNDTHKMVYHSTLEPLDELYTMEKLKEEIENFPEFYAILLSK